MSKNERGFQKLTFKQKFKIFLASTFGSYLLRFIHASLRWEKIGLTPDLVQWADNTPLIGAFWHGRLLMIPWMYLEHKSKNCKNNMYVLVSHHADGRITAAILSKLGISTVFGSSTYGGVNAVRDLAEKLSEGHHICFTPDGPRGPLHKSKAGVLALAMLSGAPIYPVTYSAEHYWQLKSWDQMIIPKPFSKAVYVFGKPLYFKRDLTKEEQQGALKQIDNALNEVNEQADSYFKNKSHNQ